MLRKLHLIHFKISNTYKFTYLRHETIELSTLHIDRGNIKATNSISCACYVILNLLY